MIIKKFDKSSTKKPLAKPNGKYTIHNVQIVDASGSMFSGTRIVDGEKMNKYAVARRAIEVELTDIASVDEVDYTYTAVEFTDDLGGYGNPVRYLCKREGNLGKIKFKRAISQVQARMTPLWDAVGTVLQDLLDATEGTNEKALIQIWTDGGENSSSRYSAPIINDLIKQCEAREFTVTFGGTPQDVANVKQQLSNLDEGNFVEYSSVADEMNMNFGASRQARVRYTASAATGDFQTRGFFKEVVKTS